jgi:cyclase
MDHDGTKDGFANTALAQVADLVNIPIIASGGAGAIDHFADAFALGKADAALAASVFHYKEIEIKSLKAALFDRKIPVRL